MSTTSAPRGLKPIGLLGGMPFAGSTMEISIDSGYATAIFNASSTMPGSSGFSEGSPILS